MLGKDLSEALNGIADDKIEAAANMPQAEHRPVWVRFVACAAVVALLLTAFFWPGQEQTHGGELIAVPGIMKAYACDLNTTAEEALSEFELTENKFTWRAVWATAVQDGYFDTPHLGRPITFHMPKDYYGTAEITFCISSKIEGFCKETVLANGETFYLTKQVDVLAKHNIWKEYADKDFYMDILIYADGKIAGYGVMHFYMNKDNGFCYAYKCVTACFPMVDGELQDISEEYIWSQIEEYKQTQPEGQGAEFFRKLHENDG